MRLSIAISIALLVMSTAAPGDFRNKEYELNIANPADAHYKIDTGQSRFMVRAFAGGLLSSIAGHDHNIAIKQFSGDVHFTYGSVEPASMQMTIKADSLAITDKVSDSDRQKIESTMRDEVLEVGKYPEISFKTSSISAAKLEEGKFTAKLNGELTLHGATHPLTVTATLDFGQNLLHARGQFGIRQSTFGIKQVSVAGGTVKVKDDLKFSFDIVAHP
ncbi:MAG TPA: YceI family protein [Blastocatellia bacterium]|nr:YceI family protein [Blastocatellia bacterium]